MERIYLMPDLSDRLDTAADTERNAGALRTIGTTLGYAADALTEKGDRAGAKASIAHAIHELAAIFDSMHRFDGDVLAEADRWRADLTSALDQ